MTDPTIIEEPWLEITTRTGLKISMPGTLDHVRSQHAAITTASTITGEQHYLSLQDIQHIRQYSRKVEPARLERSRAKVLQLSSPPSGQSFQTHGSPSATPASPSSGWPGDPPSTTTH